MSLEVLSIFSIKWIITRSSINLQAYFVEDAFPEPRGWGVGGNSFIS